MGPNPIWSWKPKKVMLINAAMMAPPMNPKVRTILRIDLSESVWDGRFWASPQNRPSQTDSERSMRKIVLTFGFIGGAIMAALMSITFFGFHDQIGFGPMGAVVGYTG